jgi:pyruvate/2-oxoglutarate/acetoin dehydrogenase E1 component
MPSVPKLPSEGTFREAIRLALHDSMAEDPDTVFIGLGATDPGAIFGTTAGLLSTFGPERVFDGPTSENAMTGVGVGAAIAGLKPIMSHQRLDFFLLAMDQLVNSAAKWHYMFGGEVTVPLTIRLIIGRGWGQGPTHSQNYQAWFAHVPGLKVVAPAFPRDSYGLLRASIEDPNPVVFLEHRWLHNVTGDLTPDALSGQLGRARVCREGADATICASGLVTLEAIKAADWLAEHGVSCDVIDLRTLNPIDWETVFTSVAKTGRLVAVDSAAITGSVAGEVVARITTDAFSDLRTAPIRVAQPDIPEPTSPGLTEGFHVTARTIAEAALASMGRPVPQDVIALDASTPHDVPGPWFSGPF